MNLPRKLLGLGCALFGAATLVALPLAAQEKKPNIVFILLTTSAGAISGCMAAPSRRSTS